MILEIVLLHLQLILNQFYQHLVDSHHVHKLNQIVSASQQWQANSDSNSELKELKNLPVIMQNSNSGASLHSEDSSTPIYDDDFYLEYYN
jgi:hypothetical protein